MTENEIGRIVVDSAVSLHKALGPGLLESAYEECLGIELGMRGVAFERQVELPVVYKERPIDAKYRIDFVVGNVIALELKAVERILPIHEAQLLTYMRLGGYGTGLLLNFNVPVLKDGVRRLKL